MEQRLIDANALKEEISSLSITVTGIRAGKDILRDVLLEYRKTVLRIIEEQQTIEAEPVKHGRWIPLEYDGYADGFPVWDLWECSQCQEEHSGDEDTLTPYCPNCGCKMNLEG